MCCAFFFLFFFLFCFRLSNKLVVVEGFASAGGARYWAFEGCGKRDLSTGGGCMVRKSHCLGGGDFSDAFYYQVKQPFFSFC